MMPENTPSQILVFESNTMLNTNRKRKSFNLSVVGNIMDELVGRKALIVLPRAEELGHKLLLLEDMLWKENLLRSEGLFEDKEYRRKIEGSQARRVPVVDADCIIFQNAYVRGVEFYENLFSLVQTKNVPVNVLDVANQEEMVAVCGRRQNEDGAFLVYRKGAAYYPQHRMLIDSASALDAKQVVWLEHPDEMLEYYRNTPRIYSEEFLSKKREYLRKMTSTIASIQPKTKFYISCPFPEALGPIVKGEHAINRIDTSLRLQNFAPPPRKNCELPLDENVREAFLNDAKMATPAKIALERVNKRKIMIRVSLEAILPKTKTKIDGKTVMARLPNQQLMFDLMNFANEGGHVIIFPSCAVLGARLEEVEPYVESHQKQKILHKSKKTKQISDENFDELYEKGKSFLSNLLHKGSKRCGFEPPLFKVINSHEDCNEFGAFLKQEVGMLKRKHSFVAVIKGKSRFPNETFILTHLAKNSGVRSVVDLCFNKTVNTISQYQSKELNEVNGSHIYEKKIAPLRRLSGKLNEFNISFWASVPFTNALHTIRGVDWDDEVKGAVRVLPEEVGCR